MEATVQLKCTVQDLDHLRYALSVQVARDTAAYEERGTASPADTRLAREQAARGTELLGKLGVHPARAAVAG